MQAAGPLGPAAPVNWRGREKERGREGEVERLSMHWELPNFAERLGKLRGKLRVLDWSAGLRVRARPE